MFTERTQKDLSPKPWLNLSRAYATLRIYLSARCLPPKSSQCSRVTLPAKHCRKAPKQYDCSVSLTHVYYLPGGVQSLGQNNGLAGYANLIRERMGMQKKTGSPIPVEKWVQIGLLEAARQAAVPFFLCLCTSQPRDLSQRYSCLEALLWCTRSFSSWRFRYCNRCPLKMYNFVLGDSRNCVHCSCGGPFKTRSTCRLKLQQQSHCIGLRCAPYSVQGIRLETFSFLGTRYQANFWVKTDKVRISRKNQ